MPRSHRGRSGPSPSIIIPLALTLTTAAIATAGLYFFSSEASPPAIYPGSDSEREEHRRSSRRQIRRSSRRDRHDHITEEDTDAIEDSRLEEERLRRRKNNTGGMFSSAGSYMRGAASGAMDRLHAFDEDDEEEYMVGNEEDERNQRESVENRREDTRASHSSNYNRSRGLAASGSPGAITSPTPSSSALYTPMKQVDPDPMSPSLRYDSGPQYGSMSENDHPIPESTLAAVDAYVSSRSAAAVDANKSPRSAAAVATNVSSRSTTAVDTNVLSRSTPAVDTIVSSRPGPTPLVPLTAVAGATVESSKVESSKVESSKVESSKVESSKVESSKVESSKVAGSTVAGSTQPAAQYVPLPRRKKPVVIVVQEAKALQGHESDGDFEEALLPTRSLLSQLPRPLKLANTNLNILIHSPHLSSHSPPAKAPVKASSTLTIQAPELMPSPSLQATRFDDATKSSYELAQSIMPSDTSSQNIKQFQSLDALVPILKELAPEVIYIEEGAVDSEGKVVEEILTSRMARSVVIVVGGGDDELAGLVSSDDESVQERRRGEGKWWGEAGDVRRRHGKMVEVVEKWALEDDWRRRVEEE